MRLGCIEILFDYDNKMLEHNRKLTVFVIDRKTNKVRQVSVVERESVHVWYKRQLEVFSLNDYQFMISTTSIVGEIGGIHEKDFKSDSHGQTWMQ